MRHLACRAIVSTSVTARNAPSCFPCNHTRISDCSKRSISPCCLLSTRCSPLRLPRIPLIFRVRLADDGSADEFSRSHASARDTLGFFPLSPLASPDPARSPCTLGSVRSDTWSAVMLCVYVYVCMFVCCILHCAASCDSLVLQYKSGDALCEGAAHDVFATWRVPGDCTLCGQTGMQRLRDHVPCPQCVFGHDSEMISG